MWLVLSCKYILGYLAIFNLLLTLILFESNRCISLTFTFPNNFHWFVFSWVHFKLIAVQNLFLNILDKRFWLKFNLNLFTILTVFLKNYLVTDKTVRLLLLYLELTNFEWWFTNMLKLLLQNFLGRNISINLFLLLLYIFSLFTLNLGLKLLLYILLVLHQNTAFKKLFH
jgi:hypothetical protein